MKHKKGFAAVLLTLIISELLSVSAFAASDGFSDVPEASPFYESVTYLAGQGITYGTGKGRYAPDTPITVRQWATMLCRAFDKGDALSDPAGYGGDACINQGYADGWLNLPAMAAPDSRLCRYAIYESGFTAFDIALYSSQLYPEGETLSSQDNAFHAAVSFGLGLFETLQHCYYTVPCPASSIKLTAIRLKSDGCTVCIMTISYNLRIANQ